MLSPEPAARLLAIIRRLDAQRLEAALALPAGPAGAAPPPPPEGLLLAIMEALSYPSSLLQDAGVCSCLAAALTGLSATHELDMTHGGSTRLAGFYALLAHGQPAVRQLVSWRGCWMRVPVAAASGASILTKAAHCAWCLPPRAGAGGCAEDGGI
jgi:hypothetical protein